MFARQLKGEDRMVACDARMLVRRDGDRREGTAMPNAALRYPARQTLRGPVTRARQARSIAWYAGAFGLAIGLITVSSRSDVVALALGLMVPGGGFLLWAGPGDPMQILAICLFAGSHLAFLAAVAIWFATGNVLLPFAVWLVAALGAAGCDPTRWGAASESIWQPALQLVPLGVVSPWGWHAALRPGPDAAAFGSVRA